MDRTYWCEFGSFLPGEMAVGQQRGIRLYDGDERTDFDSGRVQLTSHRVIWDDEEQEGRTIALDLSIITRTETVSAGFRRSAETAPRKRRLLDNECHRRTYNYYSDAKIKLLLSTAKPDKSAGPSNIKKHDYIQLSFRKDGHDQFLIQMKEQFNKKLWENTPGAVEGGLKLRKGIVGIERAIAKKQRETDKVVDVAFKDLDALIDKAKDMVLMVNKFAAKLEEKKGSVSEDETAQFRAYLLSAGISSPVTRETHGSGSNYHKELGKQLSQFLDQPLKDSGGILTLSDVYCLFNRARGLELVSPDDLINACNTFESLGLPLRLRTFESGVLVVQSSRLNEEAVIENTLEKVKEFNSLTAQELSHHVGVSIMLATERLLVTEKAGKVCRDDSVEGLKFYPNRFLTE